MSEASNPREPDLRQFRESDLHICGGNQICCPIYSWTEQFLFVIVTVVVRGTSSIARHPSAPSVVVAVRRHPCRCRSSVARRTSSSSSVVWRLSSVVRRPSPVAYRPSHIVHRLSSVARPSSVACRLCPSAPPSVPLSSSVLCSSAPSCPSPSSSSSLLVGPPPRRRRPLSVGPVRSKA